MSVLDSGTLHDVEKLKSNMKTIAALRQYALGGTFSPSIADVGLPASIPSETGRLEVAQWLSSFARTISILDRFIVSLLQDDSHYAADDVREAESSSFEILKSLRLRLEETSSAA